MRSTGDGPRRKMVRQSVRIRRRKATMLLKLLLLRTLVLGHGRDSDGRESLSSAAGSATTELIATPAAATAATDAFLLFTPLSHSPPL